MSSNFPKAGLPASLKARRVFSTPDAAVERLESRYGASSNSWSYQDAGGKVVGYVVRWDTPRGKLFRPISSVAGGWVIGGVGGQRPLFGLPQVLASDVVFVAEGEKAAEAVRHLGLVATTSMHGSRSAAKTDWSPLAGKRVVILPDNDEAGEQYANDIIEILGKLTPKSTITVVRLGKLVKDFPKGGDMADLLNANNNNAQVCRALLDRWVEESETVDTDSVTGDDHDPQLDFKPFPVGLLPSQMAETVRRYSNAIGCDPSYVAMPMLAVSAAAIGATRVVELKPGWQEPPILWVAVVGESGTAKSPALSAALKPMHEAENRAHKDYLSEYCEYEQARSDASQAEGDRVEPIEPTAKRLLVSDITQEALAPILDKNPRGLLLERDELSGWFDFDCYKKGKGGSDAAAWLSMYNAMPITVDRKTGKFRHIRIPRPVISICGGIQPGILKRALSGRHEEDGLAARLLMVMPPRRPKMWQDEGIDTQAEQAYDRVIQRLLSLDFADGDNHSPLVMTLSPEALAKYKVFYDEHAAEMDTLSGLEAAIWSKHEALAGRLALIIELLSWAWDESKAQPPDTISVDSMKRAVGLVRWIGNEARRILAVQKEGEDDRKVRELLELVRANGGSLTARELMHNQRRAYPTAELAEEAINALVKQSLGHWEVRQGEVGRPSKVFIVKSATNVHKTLPPDTATGGFVFCDNVADSGKQRDPNTVVVTRASADRLIEEVRRIDPELAAELTHHLEERLGICGVDSSMTDHEIEQTAIADLLDVYGDRIEQILKQG